MMHALVVTHLFGCVEIEIIALFLSCTKETEPGARCIALKPLVSHLRYASQVINLLLLKHDPNYLCPGNYQPSKDSQGNTVTIPIENNTANFKLNLLLPPMPSDNVSYIITFLV